MSIILRDATNAGQQAEIDALGNVHVLQDATSAVRIIGPRAALGVFSVQSTSNSPSSLITAGTGFTDLVTLILTNEGTATVVSISDGTNTYKFALGAGAGINVNFPSTLPAATTATAWTISNSASQTVDASGVYLND
jgi:hypothetical protein